MSLHEYFDSSALVKRYVTEQGSQWVQHRCADKQRSIVTVSISQVEIAAALAAKRRGQFITQEHYALAGSAVKSHFRRGYVVLSVTQRRISRAVELTAHHRLRGYDALHLACALLLNDSLVEQNLPPLTFVAADTDLLLAAQAEDLATANPNDYP